MIDEEEKEDDEDEEDEEEEEEDEDDVHDDDADNYDVIYQTSVKISVSSDTQTLRSFISNTKKSVSCVISKHREVICQISSDIQKEYFSSYLNSKR